MYICLYLHPSISRVIIIGIRLLSISFGNIQCVLKVSWPSTFDKNSSVSIDLWATLYIGTLNGSIINKHRFADLECLL